MFLYPNGNSVRVVPRVRLGDDGNVYFDMYPHGFIAMSASEATSVRDDLSKALGQEKPAGERRQNLTPKAPPLFAGRPVPEGRTDFDREDDATGA